MGKLEGTVWPKVAVILLLIAFLLHLIALGAPQWARSDESKVVLKATIGLWRECTYPATGGHSCTDFVDLIKGDWLKASQSFMILGMFALLGAVAVTAMYAFVPDFVGNLKVSGASVALSATAALFTLIAVGSFGAKFQEHFKNRDTAFPEPYGQLYWAWGIALTDMLINWFAVACLVFDLVLTNDDY